MAWKWSSQTTEYMSQNNFFELLLQRKLSFVRVYTQVIWRAFRHTSRNFPAFQTSLKFGFLVYNCSTLWRLCLVFLFDSLKGNSITCQIYWIPDLQSLKLVCSTVVNTWKQKYVDSWLLLTRCDVYLIEQPVSSKCENTLNTGWVILILH